MFVTGADRFRNEESEAGTRRLLLRVCEEIAAADMVRECRAGACRVVWWFWGCDRAVWKCACQNVGRVNKGQGSECREDKTRLKRLAELGGCEISSPHQSLVV